MTSEIRFGVATPTLRFYRSSSGLLAGVCKGLAQTYGINTNLVRTLWVISIVFYGFGLGAYLIAAISLPRQDRLTEAFDRRILGVCGRLSKRMNWEVGLVRAAALLLAFGSFGFAVLGYVILYFSFEDPQPQ